MDDIRGPFSAPHCFAKAKTVIAYFSSKHFISLLQSRPKMQINSFKANAIQILKVMISYVPPHI